LEVLRNDNALKDADIVGSLAARSANMGVAADNLEASDHRPIWAIVSLVP